MVVRIIALVVYVGLYMPHLLDVMSWYDQPAATSDNNTWSEVIGLRILDIISKIVVYSITQIAFIIVTYKYWKSSIDYTITPANTYATTIPSDPSKVQES